ncbi:hypothetical protein ABE10_03240 [Bacillus toyonensis]|nr:hypothetical protein [Bacillus toyonensis]
MCEALSVVFTIVSFWEKAKGRAGAVWQRAGNSRERNGSARGITGGVHGSEGGAQKTGKRRGRQDGDGRREARTGRRVGTRPGRRYPSAVPEKPTEVAEASTAPINGVNAVMVIMSATSFLGLRLVTLANIRVARQAGFQESRESGRFRGAAGRGFG